jgi:hypothetical protein
MLIQYIRFDANPENSIEMRPNGDYEGIYIFSEERNKAIELRVSHPLMTTLINRGKSKKDVLDNLKINAISLLNEIEEGFKTTIFIKSGDNYEELIEKKELYNNWKDKIIEVIPV